MSCDNFGVLFPRSAVAFAELTHPPFLPEEFVMARNTSTRPYARPFANENVLGMLIFVFFIPHRDDDLGRQTKRNSQKKASGRLLS